VASDKLQGTSEYHIKAFMKTKLFLLIFLSFLFDIGCSQTNNQGKNLNLSFEDIQDGKPQGWVIHSQPNYSVSLDSVTVKSGKYSIAIEFVGGSTYFHPIMLTLPYNYEGRRMVLTGYIKTENVDGYAGLWMRIDPKIAFSDMSQQKICETTDWKKYEIGVDMNPAKTQQIVLGGLLAGKGKMWLDDLQITIDGKDISEAKPFVFLADKDKEFDTGSNIVFPILNKQKINDLDLLGKIWGFLKYYHPAIAAGNYNWDYELFRILPEYLKITDMTKRDDFLLQWIKKYGEIPDCKSCMETPVDAFLKPDLSWIDNSNIYKELKNKLKEVYQNRSQGGHFYIEMNAQFGNPVFKNENPYSNMSFPDAGFRLLALYRYWNMIQYFYPYKYITDKIWNTVLKEYIPKFILAQSQLEYELTALKLLGEIDDTHAYIWAGKEKIDSLRGYWYEPILLQFVENKLVVTKYFDPDLRATIDLKVGDVITHINGKAVKAIVDSVKEYYPASNETVRMRDIAGDMLRSTNQTIHINYISSNQAKQTDLMLNYGGSMYQYVYYEKDTTKCYKFINNDIGYINLKSIKDEDIPVIKREFKNTKGIIIDIRNYPSIYVVFSLGSYFVTSNTLFVKTAVGNPDNPGEFSFKPTINEIPKPEETYQGKLVVLVNEYSQSLSELTAKAFRAGVNTTIIGSQTAGTDGSVSDIFLPGGLKTWISGIGVYYPDGKQTQRVGIIPDIEVKPTIKGIREGRDDLLEKAIEIINNGK